MHASEALRRTPLHDRHLAAGARMVPFAGWEMPVQYAGVIPEHRAVREHAGVFDVSHMGQLEVRGPGALEFLQSMLSNDLTRIGAGQAQYTLLLDENGCPIDDLIAYRLGDDHLLLVVNAARVDDDREWLLGRLREGAVLDDRTADMAMLALQGPAALDLVDLPQLAPFEFTRAEVCGVLGIVARTGYTGEPGVEIMVAPDQAGRLWDTLLAAGAAPAGLGARDTLRLEVCYPLYGNDLSQSRTALEGGLGWVCALDRKEFVGADALRAQREAGGYDRLVAFRVTGRGIPRQGMAIRPAGEVTSGTMSPSLEVGIGMGYVPADLAAEGTEIEIDVRGRPVAAQVASKPLYVKEKIT
ncbi:MAG TPA: glycine cleavage system aminomethyltransferase GcvT [Gaiellales bacterium]|nr:glycine cleavage system aminomethyltransferase GcvT [Gaiellales bacterium]